MSSTSVHVENISHQTSDQEVRDFFSFCGKITSLSVTPTSKAEDATKSATVTFEKETAAKTALLLDSTALGPSQVHVTSTASLQDIASQPSKSEAHEDSDIAQEDKPRSRIVAEYLAHGYVLSDKVIQKAIALDQQHAISAKFTQTLQNLDSKYHAVDKAKGIDTRYHLSEKANAGWSGLNSYFEKALNTPTGHRIREFYTQGSKEVMDVHAEARRLADLKARASEAHQVPGTDKTTCGCKGEAGTCGCPAGKCVCGNCAKNADVNPAAGEHTATGPSAEIAAKTDIQPLGEKSA